MNFDKVKYALGFTCNGALLASAELYARAGVKIITSSATSGDVPDIGRNIYRLFPADQGSIQVLYPYIARRHKRVGVISEDDAYAQLLKKHFDLANEAAEKPLELVTDDFSYQETDFRALLLKLKGKEIDAIFINAATDGTFTRAVKQMRQMNFSPHIYGVYVPVSDASIGELGSRLDGAIAATLPDMVTIAGKNALGKRLIDAYVAEFGAIKSPWPVVPFTMEAFRLFHSSLSGGKAIKDLVKTPEFMKDSLIGPYTFSKHGAAEGIRFVLRQVKGGKAVDLAD
ncbi:MAG: hypothetical protein DCC75_11720 [Proteobacteria bacterium]|nr:MAG: hypothetical protein DCC75_11720 [Pseudomonadota bacterium]